MSGNKMGGHRGGHGGIHRGGSARSSGEAEIEKSEEVRKVIVEESAADESAADENAHLATRLASSLMRFIPFVSSCF